MISVDHDNINKFGMQLHRWRNIYQNKILFDKLDMRKRKFLEDNVKYQDKYKGRRCFIIGNGPSINKIDFSKLSEELVITVNDMFFHKDFDRLNSNFHFMADPAYMKLNKNNVGQAQIIQQVKRLPETDTTLLFPIQGMEAAKKYGWYKKIDISYFLSTLYFYDDYKEKIDFTKYIPGFQTVIHWGIAFAVYLGCNEIYLLGCDMTNVVSDLSLFIIKNAESNYAFDLSEECENFEKKLKISYGLEYSLYGYWKIVRGFSEIYKYCIRNNVKMYNCSEESILECIPKKKIEDIL